MSLPFIYPKTPLFFQSHDSSTNHVLNDEKEQVLIISENSMRRRKARKAILAAALAEVEENRKRMKIMNLEHAMNSSSAGSSVAGSSASGSGYRGETVRMQTFSMGPPPPVYDGRRGPGSGALQMEAFSGGKI